MAIIVEFEVQSMIKQNLMIHLLQQNFFEDYPELWEVANQNTFS